MTHVPRKFRVDGDFDVLADKKVKGKYITCKLCGVKFFVRSKGGGYPQYCCDPLCEKQRDKLAREKKARKRAEGKWSR